MASLVGEVQAKQVCLETMNEYARKVLRCSSSFEDVVMVDAFVCVRMIFLSI